MLIMLGYFSYTQGWILSRFENISPQEAQELIVRDKNISIIDVRSRNEYKKDYIEGAINMPFSEIKDDLSQIEAYKKYTILLYSERGKRSTDMARILSKNGFEVLNLKGGIVFWLRNGYLLKKSNH